MNAPGFPRLDILPEAQQALLPQLKRVGELGFVLYGGTAVALHLGHRCSIDFDFFSEYPLDARRLVDTLAVLDSATVLQSDRDTYTALVPSAGGTVKLSFFGSITFGRVGVPSLISQAGILVASTADLMATKLKALMQRVEPKDYIDIAAMVANGVSLQAGLGAAELFFGKTFSPADCLRALEYFEDPQLRPLDHKTKEVLHLAVGRVLAEGTVSASSRRSTSLLPSP